MQARRQHDAVQKPFMLARMGKQARRRGHRDFGKRDILSAL
jgi:hypothetical protein